MDQFEPPEGNLRTYLRIIRRRFPWLLAVTVLSLAIAVAFTAVQKKQYSATAELLVQPASGSVPISGTQQTVSPTEVLTELQLITNAPVKGQVTKKLGFTPNISVAEVGQTNEISLTGTARTPVLAAQVANTYAQTFVAYERTNALNAIITAELQLQGQITALDAQLKPLESETSPSAGTTATISALASQETVLKEQLAQFQVTGAESPGGVEVVSPASQPTSPSSPKTLRDGVIALVIGLLLGVGAAFAAEYFDDKVYTKDEAERLSGGVPVLAIIPRVKSWKKSKHPVLITEVDSFSPVTEAYRSLQTSLQFAGHNAQLKTILVTSASGVEGKTSTVANLGVIMAKAGERVVVVSCDLRRPRLAAFLGKDEMTGFTSVLLDQEELKDVIQVSANTPGLALLGTGPIPPNPAELLGSDKTAEIFRLLATSFDVVLIDSPPLLPVADPLVLSQYADAVLMVVMVGLTTRAELERASELLAQVSARPAGIVLNKATRRSANGSKYGYGYKYRNTQQTLEVIQDGNGLRPARSSQRLTHASSLAEIEAEPPKSGPTAERS
jgi:capsular exopolysaccharide synthesis family protein